VSSLSDLIMKPRLFDRMHELAGCCWPECRSRLARAKDLERKMSKVIRFEDLRVWKRARQVVDGIYDLTSRGQFSRDFTLRDQIRRAAVSVMANIARPVE